MEEHRSYSNLASWNYKREMFSLQQNGQPFSLNKSEIILYGLVDSFFLCSQMCFFFFFPDTVAMQASLQRPPSYTLS